MVHHHHHHHHHNPVSTANQHHNNSGIPPFAMYNIYSALNRSNNLRVRENNYQAKYDSLDNYFKVSDEFKQPNYTSNKTTFSLVSTFNTFCPENIYWYL